MLNRSDSESTIFLTYSFSLRFGSHFSLPFSSLNCCKRNKKNVLLFLYLFIDVHVFSEFNQKEDPAALRPVNPKQADHAY